MKASPPPASPNIDVAVLNFALNLGACMARPGLPACISSRHACCTAGMPLRQPPSSWPAPCILHKCSRPACLPPAEYLEANFYSCAAYGKPIDQALWGGGPAPIGCKKAPLSPAAQLYASAIADVSGLPAAAAVPLHPLACIA